MPILEAGKEILLFPPALEKTECNELLVLVGKHVSSTGQAPIVVALGVHLPSDVMDTIVEQGGSVIYRRGPRVSPDGISFVPPELEAYVETIPGKPTQMECRPILNLFPDAPPHTEWGEGGSINRNRRIPNYPVDQTICCRLQQAAERYLTDQALCRDILKVVNIHWRSLPSGDIPIGTRGSVYRNPVLTQVEETEGFRCWKQFQKHLKAAEARGIAVNVEVRKVRRF